MKQDLYSKSSNLVIAFHGCDKSLADDVVCGRKNLKFSTNDYDWLGSGIYFWERNIERALQWAKELSKRPNSKIHEPAVLGALIDLGYCFDLTETRNLIELRKAYDALKMTFDEAGTPLPQNKKIDNSQDLLLRNLDCAVIKTAQLLNKRANDISFDSVRGVFWEGRELYPNAGFREKNHIQICVCNTNCIKGYFLPREFDKTFCNP